MGGAYGLDFSAVTAMAAAIGAMSPLLADTLPAFEQTLLLSLRQDDGGDGGDFGFGGAPEA